MYGPAPSPYPTPAFEKWCSMYPDPAGMDEESYMDAV